MVRIRFEYIRYVLRQLSTVHVQVSRSEYSTSRYLKISRVQLKCDGTRTESRFRLLAKRTSPFKSAGGRQFSRLLAAEVCASAVVMLDKLCSEVVWRVLATHSIRQFPLHFLFRASPCAITFQLESTIKWPWIVFYFHVLSAVRLNIYTPQYYWHNGCQD